ncbi:MAG: hypothetical protein KKD38_06800 [Candidatus Delongbacteria bacterium]|nr:hypothetical protein [Candidatus Delongbacteria bacterium]MCG2759760.1 hypothetical protein [Candidatus Delongbacteria bacterium]
MPKNILDEIRNAGFTILYSYVTVGEDNLGLLFDGSFKRMAKESFSCNWVYACYKDKMQSALENNAPYEFYSDPNAALERQKELDKKEINNAFILRYRDYTVHYRPSTESYGII